MTRWDHLIEALPTTKENIKRALADHPTKKDAAESLGWSLSTLYKYMDIHGIERKGPPITKEDLDHALTMTDGNRTEAAKKLKVTRETIVRWIKRFKLEEKYPRMSNKEIARLKRKKK